MTKWLLVIPALERVEALASKYADQDPELALALQECKEARQQAAERSANMLKTQGIHCTECGKIFLSTQWNGYTLQCSVGCRARSFG